MCYHILYRRSDLGVVSRNPEFGHKGYAVPYAPLRRFVYPGDRSEIVGDPAVKAVYSPLIIFSCHFFSTTPYVCTSAWI